jgi:hypothetical protein
MQQQHLEQRAVAPVGRHHEHTLGPRRELVAHEIRARREQPLDVLALAVVNGAVEAQLVGVLLVVDLARLDPLVREAARE